MKTFIVTVTNSRTRRFEVEADSAEEAVEILVDEGMVESFEDEEHDYDFDASEAQPNTEAQ
jgi:hypothetical protein